MGEIHDHPIFEKDGWTLVSAEERQAQSPDTFEIPDEGIRKSLSPGDAAKLLFDIETREDGNVIDRGIDRLWVIVKSVADGKYIGVLDSDPGRAENLNLHEGDFIFFGPEHICEIDRPPREYILEKYGEDFLK